MLQSNELQSVCTTCGYFFDCSSNQNSRSSTDHTETYSTFGTLAQRRSMAVLTSFGNGHQSTHIEKKVN